MMNTLTGFLLAVLIAVGPAMMAQDNSAGQEITREEKKAAKQQQQDIDLKKIESILASRQWVLEAHTVQDRYGNSFHLNPTINFVAVDGDNGTVQLGFNGLVGWNGVGGVTIEGNVTVYEMEKVKKNRSPRVSLRFQGRGAGWASIDLTVNTSYQATARLLGDFGDRITFQGQLVPLSESVVYKGQSLF
jgi:hypothetical protein